MRKIILISLTIIMTVLLINAAYADDMVPCAFDGMLMKKAAFKVKTVYKGETLYFCTEGQKKSFLKNPSHYRQKLKSGNLLITLNFMTSKEHMKAMHDMGMKMDHSKMSGSHHLSVLIFDTEKKKYQKYARVTVKLSDKKGKTIKKPLKYTDSMKHFGGDINLSGGTYKGVVMVKYMKKDYKASFKWKS